MILPYRLLDSKLIKLRQNDYDFKSLFLLATISFAMVIAMGGLLYKTLAETMYLSFLKPLLQNIDYITISLGGSLFATSSIIFFKNLGAMLATIYLARRTRGIVIAIVILLNGLLIGSIITLLYVAGLSFMYLFSSLMTHGIFEFTALFISIALGAELLLCKEKNYSNMIKKAKSYTIKFVIPLLLVASYFEVFITPYVSSLFI